MFIVLTSLFMYIYWKRNSSNLVQVEGLICEENTLVDKMLCLQTVDYSFYSS